MFHSDGDRPNVPDIIILMTDGVPTKEVDVLEDEAKKLKGAGVRIIGIGVSRAVSMMALHPF